MWWSDGWWWCSWFIDEHGEFVVHERLIMDGKLMVHCDSFIVDERVVKNDQLFLNLLWMRVADIQLMSTIRNCDLLMVSVSVCVRDNVRLHSIIVWLFHVNRSHSWWVVHDCLMVTSSCGCCGWMLIKHIGFWRWSIPKAESLPIGEKIQQQQ